MGGSRGVLVTSNLQFAGMEAPTCVFITKNIVEETGARSGLLRATSRLVVVSYTKDVDMKGVRKRFVVHDPRKKHEEKMRKEQPLAAEVDNAAKKGDVAGIKQLQQRDTSGTPLLLELRSTSGAGEYRGNRLGLYHLTTDQREESSRQGLVYRQLHCGPGSSETQYYLYRY